MSARPELNATEDDDGIIELSAEESRKLLDVKARELLGISGEELLPKWARG